MNNENALNSSIAVLALASLIMAPGQAHALSLGASSKPTLQNTVLTSPAIFTQNQDSPAKVIQISLHSQKKRAQKKRAKKKKSLVSGLTSRLKKKNYSDVYFTKKTGSILEAEACKNDTRYFLQIAPDGEILQSTKFDSCVSPKIKSNAVSVLDQEAATPVSIEEEPAPKMRRKPTVITPTTRKTKKLLDSKSLLARRGYKHILAPRNSYTGIMACKGGIEYAFNTDRKVTSWRVLRANRKALGKCFGYGKQILSKKDLLSIMRRHGDTEIRVVRGSLPLFEAYSCLKGQRRHVKINRWGNDNIRKVGKCS